MMQTNDMTQERARKPYKKPKIESVRLVAEEAVLSTCKLSSSGAAQFNFLNCIEPDGPDCVTLLS